MKNLFSILSLLSLFMFASCKKEEVEPDTADIDLGIYKLTQDPTSGKMSKTAVKSTIWLWSSDNRQLDTPVPSTDIYLGSLYDKQSKTLVNAEYGAIGVSMIETIKPGKYLVYVMLNKSDQPGSLAYSYKEIEVGADKKLTFTKIFSSNVGNEQYEEWDKNQ